MTAGAQVIDLDINQDEDKTFGPFIFWGPDPTGAGDPSLLVALNFTGQAAEMQVRVAQAASSPTLLDLSGVVTFVSATSPGFPVAPAYPNAYQFPCTAAQSAALPAGELYYDFFLLASGLRTLWQRGKFIVYPTGAR